MHPMHQSSSPHPHSHVCCPCRMTVCVPAMCRLLFVTSHVRRCKKVVCFTDCKVCFDYISAYSMWNIRLQSAISITHLILTKIYFTGNFWNQASKWMQKIKQIFIISLYASQCKLHFLYSQAEFLPWVGFAECLVTEHFWKLIPSWCRIHEGTQWNT